MRNETTLVKTVILKAPPSTVWSFLTDKDKLGTWFHPAEADLAQGQDYALVGADDRETVCWGTVELMEPPNRLVYSFTVKPLNGVMTKVSWTLEAVPCGTRLTLEHSGLSAASAGDFGLLQALDKGWDEHLGRLREGCS